MHSGPDEVQMTMIRLFLSTPFSFHLQNQWRISSLVHVCCVIILPQHISHNLKNQPKTECIHLKYYLLIQIQPQYYYIIWKDSDGKCHFLVSKMRSIKSTIQMHSPVLFSLYKEMQGTSPALHRNIYGIVKALKNATSNMLPG